ncbi:MAG: DNA polymerase [Candidatus Daviesbacteria bacterium]|nr:DNA polymerase [Candidatus Daviesbacteria bacterium]
MKRLVLVDGNALLHRAYHATPPFTTSKGELVNAVFGFSSMILKVISELHPEYLAVAWDEKGPTFRHQAYTQYKATRGPADEGLSNQYKRVHEVVRAFNIPEFKVSGYEADDLIGTLALQAQKEKDLEIVIVTGDRDIMQLIDKKIKVFMPKKTLSDVGLYGVEEFMVKYGFFPKQLTDYKGLAGDASDNIPGVAGIGDVTATKLIHQFGSIEEIYNPKNLKTLPERTQTLLSEGAESAVMSKKLAMLDTKAPIKLNLKACVMHDFDKEKVVKLFEELEFKSLIARLPEDARGPVSSISRRASSLDAAATRRDALLAATPRVATSDFAISLDNFVAPILEKMSKTGVLIDLKFLSKFGKELKAKLAKLEKDIYSKVGHQCNLNSPKQLSQVLFDELKLPVVRKTKTGRSTDEETLQELSSAHPVVPFLLQYRQLFKLVSTYIDSLPKFVGPDGRIHSTFNVEGAATGRLSSKDPNLQNIPVKGSAGGEIRKAFVAPKGKILLGADYSQIELRIMAHLADDPGLKKAFEQSLDIHGATASRIFGVPVDKVTRQQRMVAKTMNFATLYGQGPHALSRQLGVKYEVARQYIEEYFEQFPKVREWMQKTLAFGYENGYIETLWGRKRYIPELRAENRMIKSAGERAAVNHPVQGTAADMIKKAMVEIEKELSAISYQLSESLKADKSPKATDTESCRLILQVHDELLFECNPKRVNEVARMVKEKMENALKLSVPVLVDLKTGKNWGEMKPLRI